MPQQDTSAPSVPVPVFRASTSEDLYLLFVVPMTVGWLVWSLTSLFSTDTVTLETSSHDGKVPAHWLCVWTPKATFHYAIQVADLACDLVADLIAIWNLAYRALSSSLAAS